jgi:hypothetical protein
MEYGFLDEAGDVGTGPRSSRVLVVAVVLISSPQHLRREVKKFRTRLRKKKRQIPELKASQSPPAWNHKRLEQLAKMEIEIVVMVAEKTKPLYDRDPEELYRRLCARAVEECLKRSPSLTLRVDKRYTNLTLQAAQKRAIRDAVQQPGRTLTIEHVDSLRDPALQQADLVAWAFLQKYERGDESFAAMVQERVVVEKTLRGL